jgi:GAF domain-containing protein
MSLSKDTLLTYSHFIQPSDAFARLGRIKPREISLREVFQLVVDLAGRSLPTVVEVSVTMVQGTAAHTPAYSGDLASNLDEWQYKLHQGPCLQAASLISIESVSDMATESRWPNWTARALDAGARSSLSIGMPAHATVSGALNLYATETDAFNDDASAVAQAFASYAGLAMANYHLADAEATLARHLEAAMDSEAVIEQAKGILMGERRCTPEQAFVVLTTMAQDTGRTIRETAVSMVGGAVESRDK